MSRGTSDVLSGMGTGFEIMKKVTGRVLGKGGSDEDLRVALSVPGVADKVAELLMKESASRYLTKKFEMDVFYQPLPQVLGNLKNIGFQVEKNITPTSFESPVESPTGLATKKCEIALFHFGPRKVSAEYVWAIMSFAGYKPIDFWQLETMARSVESSLHSVLGHIKQPIFALDPLVKAENLSYPQYPFFWMNNKYIGLRPLIDRELFAGVRI